MSRSHRLTPFNSYGVMQKAGGAGDRGYHIVIVDSGLPEILGKRYQTIQAGINYAATIATIYKRVLLRIVPTANYTELLTFADYVNLVGYGGKAVVEHPNASNHLLNGANCIVRDLIFRIPATINAFMAIWFQTTGNEDIRFYNTEFDCLKNGATIDDEINDVFIGLSPTSLYFFNCAFNLQNTRIFWQQKAGDFLSMNGCTYSMDHGRGIVNGTTVAMYFSASAGSLDGNVFNCVINDSSITVEHKTNQQATIFVSVVTPSVNLPVDVDTNNSTLTAISSTGEAYIIDVPLSTSIQDYTFTNTTLVAIDGTATAATLANSNVTITEI